MNSINMSCAGKLSLLLFIIGIIFIALSLSYNLILNQITITPGPFPALPCALPLFGINSNITNITGLTVKNQSGLPTYVIEPGATGTINYTLSLSAKLVSSQKPISLDSNLT